MVARSALCCIAWRSVLAGWHRRAGSAAVNRGAPGGRWPQAIARPLPATRCVWRRACIQRPCRIEQRRSRWKASRRGRRRRRRRAASSTVTAPRRRDPRLTVRGSGTQPRSTMDSGIFLERRRPARGGRGQPARGQSDRRLSARRARRRGRGATASMGCTRSATQRSAATASRLWNAPGARSSATTSTHGRDGIFVGRPASGTCSAATGSQDLRFAVHYMYTNDSEVRQHLASATTSATPSCSRASGDPDNVARRPRPRPAVQLRQQLADRGNVVAGVTRHGRSDDDVADSTCQ